MEISPARSSLWASAQSTLTSASRVNSSVEAKEWTSWVGSFRMNPTVSVTTKSGRAPPVPFGDDGVWIEASRSQDQARRFPLHPGDTTFVGVRRVHALVHPGMKFLLVKPVPGLGSEIARLVHAQVTVLMDTMAISN